ncbi:hypothetical protein [Marinigracilibium pacificum]|uniref:Uncharacterized protein n=1 Tax=Marinigracilibium pacificum TaxID=2729599 RepID=A0A848J1N1_9BACT|nr:hypothetical protein [Marinigracilibium pacificum]NMM48219.1 hypothetical protein [Marinigracilibium pacificum]
MIIFILLANTLIAQSENDIVYKLNGEVMKGKVTAVSGDIIKFVFEGEDLEYEIKKSEINKIAFASGREQVFNESSQTSQTTAAMGPTSTPESRRGKLAVLPFDIISNDPGINPEQYSNLVQSEAASSFKKNTSGIQIQDPMTTNALLAQHGIDYNNIKTKTPKQIAELLGTEFVAYGTTTITNKGARSYGSNVTTYKDKDSRSDDRKDREQKGSEITTSSTSTVIEYDVNVGLKVINDNGKIVYSEDRNAFGTDIDSHNAALNYMIKRTPHGSKHK